MKTFKYLFVRLILILILPVPISLPAMAYYNQTFDNGVDKFKYNLSGTMVVKGQLYRSDASTFATIKKEYKGKANLPDYKVPIKKMEISGIELKQDINHSLYIEVDNLSGSKNKEYFISVQVSFWDYNSGMYGRQMSNDISESKNKKLIKSFDIPEDADEAQINIVYYAKGSAFIVKFVSHISGEKTKYKDPCAGRVLIDSKIRFNDWYGQVMIRPDCDEDDAYEFIDYDTVIYEDDRIKTEEESVAILGLEDMSTYVIKPNSILIIHTEEPNVPKWKMLVGSMLTNIKKMTEGKSLEVEMSQCICGIKGTIFAVQETGKESRVWLLIGKASVKNKKTGKKTVLKEGQKVTMKGETSKVEPFNVEAVAKSFGVPQDELKNHYTNKNAPKYNLNDICGKEVSSKGGKKSANPKAPQKKKSNKTVDNRKQSDVIKSSGNSQSGSSAPSGKYARYGAKRGIVKRVDDGGDLRVYYTTWWDDYGRLERSEITRTEEKQGKKWVAVDGYQLINIIIDDKHYMYTKSLGWKQMKNNETNYLGSGAKTVDGYKLTKSGTATVSGKPCDVFKGKKSDSTVEYYIWEGVVMKRVEKSSDGTSTTTAQSIELPNSIDSSKFAAPETGAKKKKR